MTLGMVMCPRCQHDVTRVIDVRPTRRPDTARRRRQCAKCQHRFSTLGPFEQPPSLERIVGKYADPQKNHNA